MRNTLARIPIALALASIGYVVGFGLPGSSAQVRVECFAEGEFVSCSTEHVSGRTKAMVCWDVVFSCKSGLSSTARRCDTVERGEKSVVRIPVTDFSNAERCEPTGSKVQNLTVSSI